MNGVRARYLLRRLTESPPSFLREKAVLLLRRRLDRFPATRAARRKRRLGGDYERWRPRLLEVGEAVRQSVAARLAQLEASPREIVELLCAEFDAGTFDCLGYGSLPLEQGGWHTDDLHQVRWPLDHFASLDFVRASERCDVKLPWEKSRMQWFVRVALADRVQPDDARRARALELVLDWVQHNPYGMGVNWVSAMEVAIRGVNLLVGFLLLTDRLDEETRRSFVASFGEHQRYLRRFPETSDVPGNHYLASLMGVVAMSLPAGEAQARRELCRFEEGAEPQFTAEGLHLEFAPVYHRLTLDMLTVTWALAQRFLPGAGDLVAPRIVRGEGVCRALAGPSGRLPIFGDADGGMVFDLGQEPRGFAHLTSLVGGREGAPGALADQLHAALLLGVAGESARLARGAEGTQVAPPQVAPPFVVLRSGDDHLVARAGALGLGGRASHDHEDQLSFWFTSRGRDVLVEAGSPPYTRSKVERRSGLVSSAHNVVSRAGRVRFLPGEGSVADSVRGGPTGSVVSISADGDGATLRLEPPAPGGEAAAGCPAEHLRELTLDGAGGLELVDRFRFEEEAEYESRLHLPVGALVERIEGTECEVKLGSESGALRIRFESSSEPRLRAEPYSFHPDYGAAEEALCLVATGAASGWTEVRVSLACGLGEGAPRG